VMRGELHTVRMSCTISFLGVENAMLISLASLL